MIRSGLAYSLAACLICFSAITIAQEKTNAQENTPKPNSADHTAEQSPPLKTLNGHFPFEVPSTAEQWEERRLQLQRRVLVGTGLWPLPEKTPLNPVFHGKIQRDGFTVEKVYFQSLPGHYVSGMLFRPSEDNSFGIVDGKRPAVLSPHGHGGRTMKLSDGELAKQLESGGEIFEKSGRYPKLARCAHLARMGCVAFIFDMVGYADSQQISYQIAHRHAEARPEETDRENPCFYSIEADLNLQSIMGLQTWNAIRSLDFLSELPDVDPDRLAVTGGSGGGTQTILLSAIDPRVKVAFPNGMVSTSMQGGCYCENCNYLRIGTGNVELAALFAPKPQGMTAADDWTKDMLADGYPELQKLYAMLGKPNNVMCGDLLKYPHNYNYVTRSMMYPWMAKHLGLIGDGLSGDVPLTESDFEPFTESEMAVYNDQHPAPKETGVEHERRVLNWWSRQNSRALSKTIPDPNSDKATEQLAQFREVVGGAWRVIFDRQLPDRSELVTEVMSDQTEEGVRLRRLLVSHPTWKSGVEMIELSSAKSGAKPKSIVVNPSHDGMQSKWLDSRTKVAFLENYPDSTLVVPFLLAPERREGELVQPLIDDPRSYSGFTFGYNRPLLVKRYDQTLCALASIERGSETNIRLVGQFPAVIAAGVFAADQVDELVLTNPSYRFGSVSHYRDADFVPGASKYFDLPGLVSLRAPHVIEVDGGEVPELVQQVYSAANAADAVRVSER
ncbi:acetylxylan esterase [Stieleria sp. JC731]|uniref:alpha/beta hydrolase family protein n=1 Tax=Pirellulaceae TaxID=2691357 RepID=UPI001E37C713|nr:alpha/beta hydrolase family protein [Stieleria sp. JC731]MCC9599962.1 acetylxylan esterase [Stieleria sp. JC731]